MDAHNLEGNLVRLVCRGIDTVTRIRVNGMEVGSTDNQFVEYVFDVTPVVKVTIRCTPVAYGEEWESWGRDWMECMCNCVCCLEGADVYYALLSQGFFSRILWKKSDYTLPIATNTHNKILGISFAYFASPLPHLTSFLSHLTSSQLITSSSTNYTIS